jgi:DNA invertase Pin-like site-specific DNA recombinase
MNNEVFIIPKKEIKNIYDRILRVAAYCRVSTDDDDSIDSLKNQNFYFNDMIGRQKNWTLVKVFYDEGISGTTRKKRNGFNEMIALAESKQIDLIITKEVSRFSRNLIDTLTIAKNLRNMSVYIYFVEDDLNTENARDMEELVSIAHQAQRESERTSRRVKWGQTQRMKAGVVFGRDMLGYNVKDGSLIINPDDIDIVKTIYQLFLEGDGTHVIAKKLREFGYKPKDPDGNARYKNNWSNTVILRVLRNEKYCGDLLQKKTYTVDPLSHEKKYNRGEEDMIFFKNHHEPIIDREMWEAVQTELERRAPSDEHKSKHTNRYWCSGKVYCGVCGDKFVSRVKKLKRGEKYKAWRCYKLANHGTKKHVVFGSETIEVGCNSESVNDRVLQAAISYLLDFIILNKENLKNEILEEIKAVRNISSDDKRKIKLEKEKNRLLDEKTNLIRLLANGKMQEFDYDRAMAECEADLKGIQNQLNNIYDIEGIKYRQVKEIELYLIEIDKILEFKESESSETIYKEITTKIVVYPDHILYIYLKCLPNPVKLQYEARGKLDQYKISFKIIE